MQKNAIIVGGSGYAREVISIVKSMNSYNLIGYTDVKDSGDLFGVKYIGDEEELNSIIKITNLAILGIGQQQNPALKIRLVEQYKNFGFTFLTVVAPSSIIGENVDIGEGSIIRENSFISIGSRIGKFSTISDGVCVSYDSTIGDYTNISLGVNVGINAIIGNSVLIGIGSTVMNDVSICDNCLIGAGSLVLKDCAESGIYFGVPATIKTSE